MTRTRRYPGSRPFDDTPIERLLFRGRNREKSELLHLILAHDHVLLYARSGTGKTSLLNAGVLEELRVRDYFPVMVRLNSDAPLETMRDTVAATAQRFQFEIEGVEQMPAHLTLLLSKARFWRGNTLLTPVLILDQFEELFTLHEPAVQQTIIADLSDVAGRRLPADLDDRFGRQPSIPYKVVFSVREDYLGEMESVAARIPTVLLHRFRLTPLSPAQARQAILEPAQMEDASLQARPFRYTDEAVDEMIAFLSRRREREGYRQGAEVEPFQLQIICQHIESRIVGGAGGMAAAGADIVIRKEDLGGADGMDRVLEHYYNDQIDRLPETQRDNVHELFESGLVSPAGKRISLEVDYIRERFDVDEEVLQRLVDFRLLRAEPRVGSTYYELSHDSLVSAVARTGSARRPKVLLDGARIARDRGDTTVALHHYVELINSSPEDWVAYSELSLMLLERNNLDEADTVLGWARDRGVDHPTIRLNRGRLLLSRNELPAAISELEAALTADRRLREAYLYLGDALARQGRGPSAEKCYREALALNPDDGEMHAMLLSLFLNRRQINRLEEHIAGIDDREWFPNLLPSLTKGLVESGAGELAQTILKRLIERPARSFATLALIGDAAAPFDPALAARAYEAAAELEPEAAVHAKWGRALTDLGQDEKAVHVLSKALQLNAGDTQSLVLRAVALTRLKSDNEAIEDCRMALSRSASPTTPLLYWGRNLAYRDRHEEAIEKFTEALESDPDNGEVLSAWARSLTLLDRYDEAIEKAQLAIRTDPSDSEAYYQLALALYASNRLAQAEEMFKAAHERSPARSDVLRFWGDVLSALERHDDAIEKFRRSDQLNPNDVGILDGWGVALRKTGRYQESIANLERAVALDPQSADAHEHLAQSLMEVRKTADAMAHFEQASALAPNSASIHQTWAEALHKVKRYAEAEEKFRAATRCSSDVEQLGAIYSAWGDSLRKLGRHADAEEKYRKALQFDPNNIERLTGLAIGLADQGRSAEARELLLQVERLGPTTEPELGNLGWGLYQVGDYEKSLSYSRRAVAIAPDALYSRCNAGLALLHLGRRNEAEKEYEYAVRIAERTRAADDFAYHAIDDIEEALEEGHDLPGGREVLDSLREHLDRLRSLRERSV